MTHPGDQLGNGGTRQLEAVVRPATEADVDPILDLLTEYDQPRSYFAPWYEADPTYRPEQSWVVAADGTLAAHVRLYLRTLLICGTPMRIAGIGNVITAKHARGRGYAGRVMRAALDAAATGGCAFSLLWTHLPDMYARYGFGPVPEESVDATADTSTGGARIRAATEADLPAVLALRSLHNANRSGPSIVDLELFRGARRWLGDELLVAEQQEQQEQQQQEQQQQSSDGALSGYLSFRPGTERVEILELGVNPKDTDTGRALLAAAARSTQGRLHAVLPHTLRPLLESWPTHTTSTAGLMGRPLSAPALANALSHIWPARLARTGWQQARVPLVVGDRSITLRVTDAAVTAEPTVPEPSPMPHPAEPEAAAPEDSRPLTAQQLSCLLLRGHDAATVPLIADRRDRDVLAALCPEQDFVIWPAEQF